MSLFNIDEFIEKMQNKEVSTSPYEDIRNEASQKKNYGRRIPFFKKEKNKNYKMLALKTIAFPFNPFTVETTDEYNENSKFRTETSAYTMMLAFKKYYNDNEEVKAKYMKKAKVKEWDTSNTEVLNQADINAFAEFTFPYIFTLNLIHINNKVVTGNARGADYKVDIKRDSVGKIVDTWEDKEGNIHKTPKYIHTAMEIAAMYSTIASNKYNEWVRTEGANKTDDDKAKERMKLMGESPISEERPKNYLLGYAFDMGTELELTAETILAMEEKDFAKHLVLVPYTKPVKTTVESFEGTYSKRNVYPSFYEMDVIVPDIEDKNERGQSTKWTTAEVKLSEYKDEVLSKIILGTSAHLNSVEDIDKIFLGSSYVEPYDAELNDALIKNISETVVLEKLGLTENIVSRFGGLLSDIFGTKATPILASLGDGDMAEGDEVSDKTIVEARNEMQEIINSGAYEDLNEITIGEEEE